MDTFTLLPTEHLCIECVTKEERERDRESVIYLDRKSIKYGTTQNVDIVNSPLMCRTQMQLNGRCF